MPAELRLLPNERDVNRVDVLDKTRRQLTALAVLMTTCSDHLEPEQVQGLGEILEGVAEGIEA